MAGNWSRKPGHGDEPWAFDSSTFRQACTRVLSTRGFCVLGVESSRVHQRPECQRVRIGIAACLRNRCFESSNLSAGTKSFSETESYKWGTNDRIARVQTVPD